MPNVTPRTGISTLPEASSLVRSAPLLARVREVLCPTSEQWDDWKWHFRHRITKVEQLAEILSLSQKELHEIRQVATRYHFSITPYYLTLINPEDPQDPIRIQSLPSPGELLYADLGAEDPMEEVKDSPLPGLVHRYPDRALLVVTNICPLLCRHCNRKREWPNGDWIRSSQQMEAAFDYIRKTPAIRDVIISGGDPLTLDNARLEWILASLRRIPHVEIIRFGTRFPVVLPQRIDEGFLRLCDTYGPIWLNSHFNHPNEITPESEVAVRELLRAGVPVNNQCVLMKGVNDSLETQMLLSHMLLKIRVRPYYLFHTDDVRGTEHLRTTVETGMRIIEGMRGHTSGLGVPIYAIDIPGGGGKIPLQPNYLLDWTEQGLTVRNYEGLNFFYRDPCPEYDHPKNQMASGPLNPGEKVSPRLQRRTKNQL